MYKQNNKLAMMNKKYCENVEKLEFENKKIFFNYNDEIDSIMNFLNFNTNVFLSKLQILYFYNYFIFI